MKCKCGKETGKKIKRCAECNTTYMRAYREKRGSITGITGGITESITGITPSITRKCNTGAEKVSNPVAPAVTMGGKAVTAEFLANLARKRGIEPQETEEEKRRREEVLRRELEYGELERVSEGYDQSVGW